MQPNQGILRVIALLFERVGYDVLGEPTVRPNRLNSCTL